MKKIYSLVTFFLITIAVSECYLNSNSDSLLDNLIEKYLESKRYFKNDQKPKTQWISFNASFYARERVKDNMPASGIRGTTLKEAIKGLGLLQVSVDPREIPLYSRFRVKLWDGWTIVPAIALDVGPTKRLIDIYVDKISEAINYGIKRVQVQIVDY